MKELGDGLVEILMRIAKLNRVVNLVKLSILKVINVSLTSRIDVLSESR